MAILETIIVKKFSNEGRKEKGIYVNPTFDEYLYKYEVIRGGTKPLPKELKKGDIVYSRHTNGQEFELHGEQVKIINRNEIMLPAQLLGTARQ